MRKTILIAAAFLVLTLVAVSIEKDRNSIYSFNPSFKAALDYDIEDYSAISSNISQIIKTCSDKKDMENCIKDIINTVTDFDFYLKNRGRILLGSADDWNKYCEGKEEDFFYDFVEFYRDCRDSFGDSCRCEFDLERYDFEMIVESEGHADYITLKIPGTSEFVYSEGFNLEAPKITLKNKKADIQTAEKTISSQDKIIMIKDGSGIFFAENDNKIKTECKIDNKYFKACAVGQKKMFGENPITGEIKEQEIVTRLAFKMLDLPPPPLDGVEAFDKKSASNSLMIKWDESEAADVVKYAVYYSVDEFISKNLSECALCKKIEIEAVPKKTTDGMDLAQEPEFDKGVYEYYYDGSFNEIKEGVLYHVKSDAENYYFYSLEVPENIGYYVAVTAIDAKGNEIDNVRQNQKLERGKSYVQAESKDDIAPGRATQIVPPSPPDYLISWTAPEINIDSTLIDPNSRLDYVVVGYDEFGLEDEITETGNEYLKLTESEYNTYVRYKILPVKNKIYGKESPERDYLLE